MAGIPRYDVVPGDEPASSAPAAPATLSAQYEMPPFEVRLSSLKSLIR